MREEITPKIRVRHDGIDVIIRKVVFEQSEIAVKKTCPGCGGDACIGIVDGVATICQKCAGKGFVYTGERRMIDILRYKYGLTHSGEWIAVAEGYAYPDECFFTIDELSVGEDRGPGEVITARDVYLNLFVDSD